MAAFLRILLHISVLLPISAFAAGFYVKATVNEQAQLVLTKDQGATETPAMDINRGEGMERQTGFAQPLISPDRTTVGWLSLYPNCCTSYDIPRELVLYRHTVVLRRFRGNEQSIFKWAFVSRGNQVAYCQGPLHFSDYRHFELRRISDGKLSAEIDVGEGLPEKVLPAWAAALGCP